MTLPKEELEEAKSIVRLLSVKQPMTLQESHDFMCANIVVIYDQLEFVLDKLLEHENKLDALGIKEL